MVKKWKHFTDVCLCQGFLFVDKGLHGFHFNMTERFKFVHEQMQGCFTRFDGKILSLSILLDGVT